LSNGPPGASAVMLGALGALVFQRLVLGAAQCLGGYWLEPDGALSAVILPGCPAHAQALR